MLHRSILLAYCFSVSPSVSAFSSAVAKRTSSAAVSPTRRASRRAPSFLLLPRHYRPAPLSPPRSFSARAANNDGIVMSSSDAAAEASSSEGGAAEAAEAVAAMDVTDSAASSSAAAADSSSPAKSSPEYANASTTGEIPTFDGDDKAKATDYANYFCSYAQLYHQKQMLADHNRMAAYHAAIMGNAEVFKDKVVMDVGTGSGILAVWAAKAGARRVYAVEYTDMAKHAERVMEANGVADVVTVIKGAVEDIALPVEEHGLQPEEGEGGESSEAVVDIMISEWMGYFLLRESMLDSLIRARDRFLKRRTGLMLPSHATMYVAPIQDEDERKLGAAEYAGAMGDWTEFVDSTRAMYGVDMNILEKDFEREQREYYLLSSHWSELGPEQVLCDPVAIKEFDMATCTIEDARGLSVEEGPDVGAFDFDVDADAVVGPISGVAGWFDVDFKSRTDNVGIEGGAPALPAPAHLSTAPENGYTHWGQQSFHFPSSIPLIHGETTRIHGTVELTRTKENLRLYNARMRYRTSRRKTGAEKDQVLMQGDLVESVYQVP